MGHGLTRADARVVAVVQARMSSTRLPGKSLAAIGKQSALGLLLHRLSRARELSETVVATSIEPSDDAIDREAARLSAKTLRGPLSDVLARFVLASEAHGADAVVRITADCPFTDPEVVDQVVGQWRATEADYVTNTLAPRSFPDGFDVEVISEPALRRVDQLAKTAEDREHVTTYIRARISDFRIAELRLEPSLGHMRVTLDTAEDLRLMGRLITELGPDASMREVAEALGANGAARVIRRP